MIGSPVGLRRRAVVGEQADRTISRTSEGAEEWESGYATGTSALLEHVAVPVGVQQAMRAQSLEMVTGAAQTVDTPSHCAAVAAARPGDFALPLRALRALLAVTRAPVIVLGLLAGLHLASLNSQTPLFCLVQIDGQSMEPTFRHGEQAAFARLPWRLGSVVVADVGEPDLVVKRVLYSWKGTIFISGDNTEVSETYRVAESDIRAVLLCRVPFSSPVAEETARPVIASRHREPTTSPPGLTAPVWPPRD